MRGLIHATMVMVVALILYGQTSVFAANDEIPSAHQLAEMASLTRQHSIPTIVFVSREACPYCRTLRENILGPMLTAGKFSQRANLVEVCLDQAEPFTGFGDEVITATTFAERYKAAITPTLLFLDADGREIGKRRIGISNLELYWFYMNQSIDEALSELSESN